MARRGVLQLISPFRLNRKDGKDGRVRETKQLPTSEAQQTTSSRFPASLLHYPSSTVVAMHQEQLVSRINAATANCHEFDRACIKREAHDGLDKGSRRVDQHGRAGDGSRTLSSTPELPTVSIGP
ncbi:hypothetical protein NDA11_002125 [Ustilago hordei]|uniref:Uncharacterized protein n=1 Tax=Ustilago hordei TaxID=120017 RepID=I2FR60_USTHO|nr:uncharacterized protein UHO2_05545 [Ustilago hordei]KAJ1042670.1 hypothetical protein NDA10_000290 [Ustilago hordei]KAJ1572707.1 hypothetical protein NDA15_001360 [Ustilago hordei]KAJ1575179.1 hypothetical protein NDA11_002125 [Ustilago hordei]KAJ1575787.1 hypothetical protein NDA12_005681 [Ustilago hordei]KAJ1598146.1 hypothetical protein NDA14_006031 [Ustilago hordei]